MAAHGQLSVQLSVCFVQHCGKFSEQYIVLYVLYLTVCCKVLYIHARLGTKVPYESCTQRSKFVGTLIS